MKKMSKLIRQRDFADCGPVCLASICAHYQFHLSVAHIRQLAGTDKRGTTLKGLLEAAEKLHFDAKGVRASVNNLVNIPLPAIAHLSIREELQHFVVMYKISAKHVELMDPADGKLHQQPIQEFVAKWTGILVIMFPNQHFEPGNRKIPNWYRLWQLVRPHQHIIFQVIFGALVYSVLGLASPIFVQKIADNVIIEGNRNLLNLMGILMIAILILQIFIGSLKTMFSMRIGQQIDARLILGYYKHLLKLPQQFFDTMRVGEIISRVSDAVKIRVFINEISIGLLVNLLIVLFSFLMMLGYYWKLALLLLMVLPLYVIIYLLANKLNRKMQRRLMEDSAELESQFVESLNAIGTIKRFGLEEFTNLKTETRFVKLLRTVYSSGINTVLSGTSTEMVSHLLTIVLLWLGAGYVLDGEITLGELFSFYTLIGFFTTPVAALIGANKMIQDALIAANRLFEIMDLEIEANISNISLSKELIGDIRFENVAFRYGTRTTVFEDLTLHIKKGNFTAIVGESGSGKSTLMSLLQNIYPIQQGNIYIGAYPITYFDNASLRNLLKVVPQQIDLFNGNIIDNIAIGDDRPDMQKILDLCSQLGIIHFIEGLPNGFYTQLGENGATLSGGQKQRIAIARALYGEPEILILDEATSSLDLSAELYIQQTIELLLQQQKTIIIIAHRLSTVSKADQIILLDKGTVAEKGTHHELMALGGRYNDLWKLQFA
jgi:ABC-type bacteriocin transporter